jgi:hypothetical protein
MLRKVFSVCLQNGKIVKHTVLNLLTFKAFTSLILLSVPHYHLEVQANPKKMPQKTNAIFSIYGRNGIIP